MKRIKKYTMLLLMMGLTFGAVTPVSGLSKHMIIINPNTNKLGHFVSGQLQKEYDIAAGRFDETIVATGEMLSKTPLGKFKVANKLKNRPYYSKQIPGGAPANPLGDRWLGVSVGKTNGNVYGIHGNNDRTAIGKSVSSGCIRMFRQDSRDLYEAVSQGAEILIQNTDESYDKIASSYGLNVKHESNGWVEKDGKWQYITKNQNIYSDGFADLTNENRFNPIRKFEKYGIRYIEEKFYILNASGFMHNI